MLTHGRVNEPMAISKTHIKKQKRQAQVAIATTFTVHISFDNKLHPLLNWKQ
jgi:hypothetical protein